MCVCITGLLRHNNASTAVPLSACFRFSKHTLCPSLASACEPVNHEICTMNVIVFFPPLSLSSSSFFFFFLNVWHAVCACSTMRAHSRGGPLGARLFGENLFYRMPSPLLQRSAFICACASGLWLQTECVILPKSPIDQMSYSLLYLKHEHEHSKSQSQM